MTLLMSIVKPAEGVWQSADNLISGGRHDDDGRKQLFLRASNTATRHPAGDHRAIRGPGGTVPYRPGPGLLGHGTTPNRRGRHGLPAALCRSTHTPPRWP